MKLFYIYTYVAWNSTQKKNKEHSIAILYLHFRYHRKKERYEFPTESRARID